MPNDHERIAEWQDSLLTQAVDRLGHARPDAVYGKWMSGSSTVAISYAQLANIVNGLATWLVKELGPGRQAPKTNVLTYVGPNDVRYSALVLAAVKAGYVVRTISKTFIPIAACWDLFCLLTQKSSSALRDIAEEQLCRTPCIV